MKIIFLLFTTLTIASCRKFVEVAPPQNSLIRPVVFEDDATANAAVVDMYYGLSSAGLASGSVESITFIGTILSDEQINFTYGADNQQFFDNAVVPDNSLVTQWWSDMYKAIYKANAILEGLSSSASLSPSVVQQLKGESKFIRAFCYFYLVNLYGDVPVVIGSDYRVNENIGKSSQQEVYDFIVRELKEAAEVMDGDYARFNNERIRTNKFAAKALLARVYQFLNRWSDAEDETSDIIDNISLYSLEPDLNNAFNKQSMEAILQWHTNTYPNDFHTFVVYEEFGTPHTGTLRDDFILHFTNDDERKSNWIRSVVINGQTYFFPGKYKNNEPQAEFSTLFRLAEMHLIRAEARAHLENIPGSRTDLLEIRRRAGIADETLTANDAASLLDLIQEERVRELFTEQGLRWLDLKRTQMAETVLSPIKPGWQNTDTLLPIPEVQIQNSKLEQNEGY